MSNLRFQVVSEAFKKKPLQVAAMDTNTSAYYGKNVFGRKQMQQYLSADVMRVICASIDNGEPLGREIADDVAEGMKKWAMDMGATHYTHWFQPLTEGTAEKHDSFIEYAGAPGGDIIEKFSGKILIQQEPDASSFPNGGIRNTFEARGYTAWDPSSPAFVVDDTLCIPTVFVSYTGEALDYKTPLLKSVNAVNLAATAVCQYFDTSVKKVTSFLGWEQEYFLVDEGLYAARPDLLLTGRTLLGHESAKNQQLEDHYFGAIPARVQAFMKELEYEAYKYAIPCKTRHNEVAPNQFEIAPIFGETNLAIDQNLLMMSLMNRIARKHGFRVLLHEKPFAGINGSGKHCNWSLGTDTGVGLFTPGKTAAENLQFRSMCAELKRRISISDEHNKPELCLFVGDAACNVKFCDVGTLRATLSGCFHAARCVPTFEDVNQSNPHHLHHQRLPCRPCWNVPLPWRRSGCQAHRRWLSRDGN